MYFLPDQVVEYDKKRLIIHEVGQYALFVMDEKTSIQWLRRELQDNPQTYQEIHPKFLRELRKASYEKLPELSELLEQNFLKDEQGRWYVPDPSKQSDLEKMREKALLKEFNEYKEGRGRLKVFRKKHSGQDSSPAGRQRTMRLRLRDCGGKTCVASGCPDATLSFACGGTGSLP